MGTSTNQPQSRQCRDEVSRKRFSAWGKSRLEMLPSLSFFPTTLLLLSHTAASLERVPRDLYSLTYLLSNQPQHQHLLQSQTTSRPQPRIYLAQQKLRREEPRSSWTKRGIGDRNDKPPPWSTGQQASKQLDRPAPFFLPAPQLTSSQSLDFPLRREPSGRRENSFQLPPLPPPTPSLRRALRWPPWPPDPHRWSRSPPFKGGGMQKQKAGMKNLLERGWSKFWPAGHWHAWNLGSPNLIPQTPREPVFSKGGQAFLPGPTFIGGNAHTRWQNGAPSVCGDVWWQACSTPLNATPFAEARGRLGGQQFK